MTQDDKKRIRLYSALRYTLFIAAILFVSTCSLMIFLGVFGRTIDYDILTEENISDAAIKTFFNLLFLSFIFLLLCAIYNYLFVRRPLKRIIERENRLMNGDFSYTEEKKSIRSEYDLIEDGLNMVAKELGKVESLRDDFTSNISHEIKTPIAVLQNYAQLLDMGGLDEEKEKEYIHGIMNASQKLSAFATSVLKLTGLENREIYSTNVSFSLSDLLSECIIPYVDVIDEKNIDLDLDIAENITITSDRELLGLAISNIISNAVKFTRPNGRVSISLLSMDNRYRISIRDSGSGISRDDIHHIFDKYYRGKNSSEAEGTGLGLAMVKRIADILGLRIEVESEVGKGSTFSLEINVC